jgi:glycosyltransferase involved in cell wall biosynthesis
LPKVATRTESQHGGAEAERPAISIVLPAFNEEEGLPATLAALERALAGSELEYEVVVVDDGSTDGTGRLLAARTDVTVVRHRENRGYGAALKSGIAAARHPLVVVMDADGTYAAVAIPGLVAQCAGADMVVGARLGSRVESTPARSAVKWCFRQFAQWITAARIPDLNSGLRVFRKPVAERFLTLLPNGFSFTTTITVASLTEGLPVRFAVVDYMPRIGRSKVRPIRDTARIAKQLLRLGVRLAPLRTAVAVALPLLAASGLGAAYAGHVSVLEVAGALAALLIATAGWIAQQRVRRRRDLAAAELVAA